VGSVLADLAGSRFAELAFLTLILGTARALAFVMVTPLFTRFGLEDGILRTALILAFSAPVLPLVYAELSAIPTPGPFEIALLLAKEAVIGLILALTLGLPLWAVAAAGDIIDMQRGALMSEMVDPGTGDQTTPTGTLFFLMAALILVSSGWFTEVLLGSLYDTYTVWPVTQALPAFDPSAAWRVLAILDRLMETGLTLALPLVGAMLLVEIALALATKYTQQINVMILGMSVKQLVYILLVPAFFASMMYFVTGDIRDLARHIDEMDRFFDPAGALDERR
jgi:type III secretion protein T